MEVARLGLSESRARAAALILAGRVTVDGVVVAKSGVPVRPGQVVAIKPDSKPFVSRGGGKLDGALDDLGVDPSGAVALDVGASTGGFTDCLLRRGAIRVYAADVGENLLDDRLRVDPRVVVLDRVNFRHAVAGLLPEQVGLAVVDVSFISLRYILPPLRTFLSPAATVLCLVKPQFEAGPGGVGKGGVVRDESIRRAAVDGIARFAEESGFVVTGEAESRVHGPKGNREVFLMLSFRSGPPDAAS